MSFNNLKQETEIIFNQLLIVTSKSCNIIESVKENLILRCYFYEDLSVKIKSNEKNIEDNLIRIKRRQMKCVFFGLTSNGKSATINAILGKSILPSSYGRTTSCFITIDGYLGDSYFEINGVKESDINKLKDIMDQTSDDHLSTESCVSLYYHESEWLNEDIQLVDSPGVDYSKNNDNWIDTYCHDADIFVYVVNAEGTLNDSEKKFFRKVKARIADPIIFVAINKWDICDTSENKYITKLKKQHLQTVKEFLIDDLKLQCDSNTKTFFLSAKEQLQNLGNPSLTDVRIIERMKEFDRFNNTLREEMSKKAIINKVRPHLVRADVYIGDIKNVLRPFDNLTKPDSSPSVKTKQDYLKEISDQVNLVLLKTIKEAEQKVNEQCPELINLFLSADTDISCVSKYLLDKIRQSQEAIFKNNVKELISTMRNLFSSYSEFIIREDCVNHLLPSLAKELTKCLGENISKNLKKGDSEVKEKTISKVEEISSLNKNEGLISGISSVTNILALTLTRFSFPISLITGIISALAPKVYSIYSEEQKKNIRLDLEEKAMNILTNLIKESYNKIFPEIEKDIKKSFESLFKEVESARQIIKDIKALRLDCDKLSNQVKLELSKIINT